MDVSDREKSMEGRETLTALSEGMADAVAKAGASIVRVHGRRRRPGSGVVYAENLVLTAGPVLGGGEGPALDTAGGGALGARLGGRGRSGECRVGEGWCVSGGPDS